MIHPDCKKMHEDGYCLCTMVACFVCGKHHPPHKPTEPACVSVIGAVPKSVEAPKAK